MPVDVRDARADDLPAILCIYNHYVRSSAATFDTDEVTLDSRRSWFQHYAATGPHRLLVATAKDPVSLGVLGYAHSSAFRNRSAYDTSVEVSVYCDPGSVRCGVGTQLYRRLFELLAGEDLHRAYAGVALPNAPSLKLHAAFGFREVGTFAEVGRKFGRYWDVRWLERPLP